MWRAVTAEQFNVSGLCSAWPEAPGSQRLLTLQRAQVGGTMREVDTGLPATKTLPHKRSSDLHGYSAPCVMEAMLPENHSCRQRASMQQLSSACAMLDRS